MVFHALEAVKEGEKGRSTTVERTQYITRQKFFWIFCNLSLTFSKSGTLESRAGWKGLCRKGETLLIVLVACRLDAVMGSTFVRDAVVIGFICNETISIIENAGLMGLPIPAAITKAVDILKQRSETEQKG